MRTTRWITLAALLAAALTLGVVAGEKEQEIDLEKLPKIIQAAAAKAVPGITLKEAEIEMSGKSPVYELEGIADGVYYEIHMDAKGKVLGIEPEGDDEDDGDGDRDDDDEEEEEDDD